MPTRYTMEYREPQGVYDHGGTMIKRPKKKAWYCPRAKAFLNEKIERILIYEGDQLSYVRSILQMVDLGVSLKEYANDEEWDAPGNIKERVREWEAEG